MADGLSVAASVAGLVQIADVVVRRGYRYIREVKNAEKSVEQLIDEVNKLSGVLHSLSKDSAAGRYTSWAFEPCYEDGRNG
jgi:cob(I)alamin adenosyltransferase